MPFEDMEDVALMLDDAEQFLGNYWPAHNVDEAGMVALQEAYFMVKEAADAVWKLESLLSHRELGKILEGAVMLATNGDSKVLALVRALDRLKACAEGQQKKVCLTSVECEKVCAYIWWLADMYTHAKAKETPDESDTVTVTLFAIHTAEGLAKACRDHAENVFYPCPVGWYFACPLYHLGDGRCGKIKAEDWEAVMQEVQDDPQ